MKLLVFGKTGQVARELERRLPPDMTATFLGRDQADLYDPEACAAALMANDAEAVINAAAWTNVDKAETAENEASVINAASPGAMARAAAAQNIPFIHISTDYVFDGSGEKPFRPADPVAPLGAYGRTKLDGERKVRAAGGRSLILRTSWVFSAHGTNFVKTMLRLGRERETLNVVTDQVGGPTPAFAIANTLFTLARAMNNGTPGGLYHLTGAPDVSWAEFARAVMQRAGLPCRVNDIATTDYPTPARRPANSRLDCSGLTADFKIPRPDWRTALDEVIPEILE